MLSYVFLGLGLAASPGPVNVEAVRRGLRDGFSTALRISLGAVVADALYVCLVVFGISSLLEHPVVRAATLACGIAFLAYLGVMSIRAAFVDGKERAHETHGRSPFLSGLTLNLLSPSALVAWVGILGASVALTGTRTRAFLAGALILAGALSWGIAQAFILHATRRHVGERALRYVSVASGVVLLAFAAWFAYGALRGG
jgi:threonine/homoserine/homoserine lactone efflux protein